MRPYVKKLFLVIFATILVAGCSTVTTEQFNALENRVSAVERQAGSASDAASNAASAAASASQDAATAQATAERALDAANAANERAERMAETCCARK
jgi:hypothetical protein